MVSLDISFSYVSLEKAAASLGVSVSDLIHAGAFDQVQICVNIYARACGLSMQRIDDAVEDDCSDIDEGLKKQAPAHFKRIERLKKNPMPAGIYEVIGDDLRMFEMPEIKSIELEDAFKVNHRGLWEVQFDPVVEISRLDLVVLSSEIDRIQTNGGLSSIKTDQSVSTRKHTTYLNIIGAMLAQLTAGRANDTTVITQAVTDYGTKYGISSRNLQGVFAEAKRSLKGS